MPRQAGDRASVSGGARNWSSMPSKAISEGIGQVRNATPVRAQELKAPSNTAAQGMQPASVEARSARALTAQTSQPQPRTPSRQQGPSVHGASGGASPPVGMAQPVRRNSQGCSVEAMPASGGSGVAPVPNAGREERAGESRVRQPVFAVETPRGQREETAREQHARQRVEPNRPAGGAALSSPTFVSGSGLGAGERHSQGAGGVLTSPAALQQERAASRSGTSPNPPQDRERRNSQGSASVAVQMERTGSRNSVGEDASFREAMSQKALMFAEHLRQKLELSEQERSSIQAQRSHSQGVSRHPHAAQGHVGQGVSTTPLGAATDAAPSAASNAPAVGGSSVADAQRRAAQQQQVVHRQLHRANTTPMVASQGDRPAAPEQHSRAHGPGGHEQVGGAVARGGVRGPEPGAPPTTFTAPQGNNNIIINNHRAPPTDTFMTTAHPDEIGYLKKNNDSLIRAKRKLQLEADELRNRLSSTEEKMTLYKQLYDEERRAAMCRGGTGAEMANLHQQLAVVTDLKEALFKEVMDLRIRLEQNQSGDNDPGQGASCVICMDNLANVVCLPCKHLALCAYCSEGTEVQDCPICRSSIQEKMQIYTP